MTTSNSVDMSADEIRTLGSTVLRQTWPIEKLAKIREAIESYDKSRQEEIAGGAIENNIRMLANHGAGTLNSLFTRGFLKPAEIVSIFAGSYYHKICK